MEYGDSYDYHTLLCLYWAYKDYKKTGIDKAFHKYLSDCKFSTNIKTTIQFIFVIITLAMDGFVIIGFLSGVVHLILF